MKIIINENDFIEAFKRAGRSNQFSEEGLIRLYEYLIENEQASSKETELDVIGVCCAFTEYDSLEECAADNDIEVEEDEDDEDILKELEQQRVTVIALLDNGGVLVCNN